jgi:class III poly(R)-hydroxyalkanoic acid synthase PhaE subunit
MAKTSAPPFEGDKWAEATRQYWDAWRGLWQQGIDAATQGAQASTSAAPPDPIQALMDQGKLFLRLGEALAAALQRSGDALRSAEQWQQVFTTAADAWRTGLGASAPDVAGLSTAWKLPFDTWSRTVSSASLFPGDFLEQFKPETWAGDLHKHLERFLSVPGLGYTREWQEEGQEFARLGLEYQRALQDYLALFQRLNLDTFERLQRRLVELGEADEPITTLRGLYDTWVDCSEAAYFDLVNTEAYGETYGRLVNALMALKRHGRNMVDEVAGAMGLPTEHAMNTVQRRHQELRRDVAAMRAQMTEAQAGLEEIEALRREIERLRSESGNGRPTTRKATRTASKRAASKRTTSKQTASKRATSERTRRPASGNRAKGTRKAKGG